MTKLSVLSVVATAALFVSPTHAQSESAQPSGGSGSAPAPGEGAVGGAIGSTQTERQRFVVHFQHRTFTLDELGRAHRRGHVEHVRRIAADLARQAKDEQREFHALVKKLGGGVVRTFWLVNACVVDVPPGVVAQLRKAENVDFVQPDLETYPLGPVTPAPIQVATNGSNHGADALQQAGHTGDGVGIAVIDTGHDDNLAGTNRHHITYSRRGSAQSRLAVNRQMGSMPADDIIGHGTAVASVAAGWKWNTPTADRGHAFDATIAGYAIADNIQGNSTISIMAAAYEQLAAGDAAQHGVLVSNLSFSGSPNPLSVEQKAADTVALVLDILVCTSAGNSGANILQSQVNLNGLSVGATTANQKDVATFSGHGRMPTAMPFPDIVANGVQCVMARRDSEFSDQTDDGTSFSSPQVAGAATQLRARFRHLDATETKAILLASTLPSPGTGQTQVPTGAGCGYLHNPTAHAIAGNSSRHGRGALRGAGGRTLEFKASLVRNQECQIAIAWPRTDVNSQFLTDINLFVFDGTQRIHVSQELNTTVEFLRFTAPRTGEFLIRVEAVNVLSGSQEFAFASTFDLVPASPGTYNVYGQGCNGSGREDGVIVTPEFATKMGPLSQQRKQPFAGNKALYQQVFLGSDLPPGAFFDGISLRQPKSNGQRGGSADLEIYLALTNKTHLTMTNNFANNRLPNTRIKVFEGTVTFPTLTGKNLDPKNFAFSIRFDRNFQWVRRSGRNLLLEVVKTSTQGFPTLFDYCMDSANRTSRVQSDKLTSNVGALLRHIGLVVRFDVAPPEGVAPVLSATGQPVIAQSFDINLRKARANALAWLGIGFVRAFDPVPLTGTPPCRLLIRPDLVPLAEVLTDGFGNGKLTVPMPNDPNLFGIVFHNQWIVFDPDANPFGVAMSNGGTGVIGR